MYMFYHLAYSMKMKLLSQLHKVFYVILICSHHIHFNSVYLCPHWQLCPFRIPDLSTSSPVIVSGRYSGYFPESVQVSGILADSSTFVIDVKAHKAIDIPLDRVIPQVLNLIICKGLSDWSSPVDKCQQQILELCHLYTCFAFQINSLRYLMQVLARRQINTLTCLAWLSESTELEEKVSLYFLKEID